MQTAALPDRVLFDRPTAGQLWAMGNDWKASFDRTGFTFLPFLGSEAPRNFPLRVELRSVTVGAEPLSLQPGEPILDGTVVRTDRGPLVETLATAMHGVEQSFVFASLPNRGAIAVDLQFASELVSEQDGPNLRFSGPHGGIAYRDAIAIDATGKRLPLVIEHTPRGARIEIPAAFVESAVLPLVLDPWFLASYGFTPGVGTGELQRWPDVAVLQSPDTNALVWQRQWSVADQDCFGLVALTGFFPTVHYVTIDFTSANWLGPRLASNASARNFLVVAQIDDQAGTSWIGGRIFDELGGTASYFDIERGGVVGLAGNKFRPDVGGDPFASQPAYYTVVFEHEVAVGNHDIYYKQIEPSGLLRNALPSPLATTPVDETYPTISSSNRFEAWRVAWQSTYLAPPFDQDVHVAHLGWAGTVTVPPYVAAGSVFEETRPSISSWADPMLLGDRFAVLAYEMEMGGQRDIACVVHDAYGTALAGENLNWLEAGGIYQGRNQIFPEVDSDGRRFFVGYSEFSGTDYDVFTSCLRFVQGSGGGSLLVDDERDDLLNTPGVDDYWCRVAAFAGGGGATSSTFAVTNVAIGTNEVRIFYWGAWQDGAAHAVRNTGCGVPITSSLGWNNGQISLGTTVTFSASAFAAMFGFPTTIPLNGILPNCNCTLGAELGGGPPIFMPPTFAFTIPLTIDWIGTTLSVQWMGIGTSCLGGLDLSNTLDVTVL